MSTESEPKPSLFSRVVMVVIVLVPTFIGCAMCFEVGTALLSMKSSMAMAAGFLAIWVAAPLVLLFGLWLVRQSALEGL